MRGAPALKLTAWAIALTLVALPIVGLLNGWFAADRWPVRYVTIEAEFTHLSAEQIRGAASSQLSLGFFALDLSEVQRSVAELPWVERAEARKRWPDTLVLRVYERQPYAHWGDARLVSRTGQLFAVPGAQAIQDLPQLDGPDDRVADVLEFHAQVAKAYGATGLHVNHVSLSERGSWTLGLDSGATIALGRDAKLERLQRFMDVYPRLAAGRAGAFEYADLRYANGFAVKWPEPPPAAAPAKPPVAASPPHKPASPAGDA